MCLLKEPDTWRDQPVGTQILESGRGECITHHHYIFLSSKDMKYDHVRHANCRDLPIFPCY